VGGATSKAGLAEIADNFTKVHFVSRAICDIISRFRWLVAREEVVGE
jgi:hypothetical protein